MACADPEGGRGTGGPNPPEIFVLFLLLFSGSLRSPVLNIVLKFEIRITSKFKRVIPSPVIHTIPGFIYESAISMLISSKITRFYTISTKNFLGKDPQTPPPPCDITCTFYKAKTTISNVFDIEEKTRDVIFIKSIVCKAVSMAKINFDHTKAIDTEASFPLFVCVCVCFFFCLSKISGGWTPPLPDENSRIRTCSGFVFSN